MLRQPPPHTYQVHTSYSKASSPKLSKQHPLGTKCLNSQTYGKHLSLKLLHSNLQSPQSLYYTMIKMHLVQLQIPLGLSQSQRCSKVKSLLRHEVIY